MKVLAFVVQILTVSMLMTFGAAAEEAYPSRPVRLIIPYTPGGGTDAVGRVVAKSLSERWGQNVIVDNRPGGDTIIGTNVVAKSAPDGYTLLVLPTTYAINASRKTLPYDPHKDLDAAAAISKSPYVLAVNPSLAAKNLKELIALAKSKPGQLNYGSAGTGTTNHLGTEQFCMMTGIKMQHVPYKGSAPATTDLLGGQLQLYFNNTISAMAPLINAGRLRAIAVTSEKRLAALPQVPTFPEAGLPGYEMLSWFTLAAPGGTPKAIIDKISKDMALLLTRPDTIDALDKQSMEPYILSSPDQVTAMIKSEMARYAKIIKASNINIEN